MTVDAFGETFDQMGFEPGDVVTLTEKSSAYNYEVGEPVALVEGRNGPHGYKAVTGCRKNGLCAKWKLVRRAPKESVRETRKGSCWAKTWSDAIPAFDVIPTADGFVRGTYTQETLDGKTVKITWEADQ